MKKAIVLTAHNRPDYLAEVLDSWLNVRGLEDWDFYISIDKSKNPKLALEISTLCEYFQKKRKTDVYLIEQSPALGVLKHPYIMLDSLFDSGYDFVLRAEDDLIVSDGILEYFNWGVRTFAGISDAVTIHGFSKEETDDEELVRSKQGFNPWIFGTWRSKWPVLRDNWDLDYSTNNGTPLVQSGFDWNFNVRVYPKLNLFGIYPAVSRVKNIGEYGVHGTPENLPPSPSFRENNTPIEYFDIDVLSMENV